ncbi:MAG: hypothetical protein WBD27_13605, partial [Pyrinomonadaceae bacterium]
MTSKDEPGRDRPRAADVIPPKKPHATIDLKATEVPNKESGTSAAASAPTPAETAQARDTAAKGPLVASAAVADAKPAAVPPPAVPPAEPRRGGLGSVLSHLAAGVVGGFLVLLGADSIAPRLGLPEGFLPSQNAELRMRLTALEEQARGAAVGDLARKLVQSESRLARIEEQAKSLPQLTEASSRFAAETKALQEKVSQGGDAVARIVKLEDMLAMLGTASQGDQPGRLPQLTALTARIKELESAISTQTAALRRDLSQTLETRTAQVAEAGEVARSATQRIDLDLAAVKTDAARLIQRMEALKADSDRFGQTLRVVQEETGAIRSGLDGLKGDIDTRLKTVARANDVVTALAPVTSKLATLEQSLQG